MKKFALVFLLFASCLISRADVVPVDFSQIRIADGFWLPRIEKLTDVTLPVCLRKCCDETQRVKNFAIAAGLTEGKFQGIYYDDSDLYKVIEGCAYSLTTRPDARLEQKLDGIIDTIAAAQQPDGYLVAYFIAEAPEQKWTNMDRHEMYCAGHLIEAAIAYYKATGKRKLLDVAIRFADNIDRNFGSGKRFWVPGHEEIELALVKLYRVTGEKRYLELAKCLLGRRGSGKVDWMAYGGLPASHYQDDMELQKLSKIGGHAVRAMYLFTGMADYATAASDTTYVAALRRLWNDVTGTKMYATGGIGHRGCSEGFSVDYDLPNDLAYCETCASIGMAMWNQRMNMLTGESRYADVMERAVYNGVLSGISLSGNTFFYVNPLETDGTHHRQPWYDTACCPSNLSRFLPSVGNYMYLTEGSSLTANLYIAGDAEMSVDGKLLKISQQTEYPWNGKVALTLTPEAPADFELRLRVPGWCESWQLTLNGRPADAKREPDGYIHLTRLWNSGDVVELNMDMPVRVVAADTRVAADLGKRCLQRGPLVYCMEETDNPSYDSAVLTPSTTYKADYEAGLLNGVVAVEARSGEKTFRFIPYYAWDNRKPGKMKTWVDFRKSAD